jgi:CubicO group peptidase (beta-lactamase class C family)
MKKFKFNEVKMDYSLIVNRIKERQLHVDSLYIEQDNVVDKLIDSDELHELRSCAKLLVAMAVGIAIDRKMMINGSPITLETKVYPVLEKVANITNTKNIEKIKKWTVRDLLTHSTGYASQMFNEKCLADVDENKVLDYALNYDIPYDVGTRYAYNNVEPFTFAVIFEECFGINLSEFVRENIFDKLEITEYEWKNYGKYCMAATGLYIKPSDFHKVAQLLLNKGKYKDEQIVPEAWIDEMIKLQVETPDYYKPDRVFPKIGGGYFTFISRDNYVFRDGSNGQYIILNKDTGLLITIMSTEKEMSKITEIFRDIL